MAKAPKAKTKIQNPLEAKGFNQEWLSRLEESLSLRQKPKPGEAIKVGLDLGTASIVVVVLGEDNRPLAVARRFASVVRDGLVLEFAKAQAITRELKEELENDLGISITRAALAVPPGTSERDQASHGHVAYGGGLEPVGFLDEPAAANLVVGLKNGALVDIGGGTTGVALFEEGTIVHSFDEPTGGTHLSLVLAGHFKISFDQAEQFKTNPDNENKVRVIVTPVLEKIGSIIKKGLIGHREPEIVQLVGGTARTPGAEAVLSRELKTKVTIGPCPELFTPAGIALFCPAYEPETL
jgi:ethanolamine utilization protein EutJ